MKTHHITITALALLALPFLGCAEGESAEGEVVKRASAYESVLTSTTAKTEVATPSKTGLPNAASAPTEATRVDTTRTLEIEEAPKPTEETFTPELDSIDGLTLVRLVTTVDIENREPSPAASIFTTEEERVYAFVDVQNESPMPKTLTVHFIGPKGSVSGGVELEIPASVPRWRTWAYTRHVKTPGLWHVEVRDEDGMLVGALPFEVQTP